MILQKIKDWSKTVDILYYLTVLLAIIVMYAFGYITALLTAIHGTEFAIGMVLGIVIFLLAQIRASQIIKDDDD